MQNHMGTLPPPLPTSPPPPAPSSNGENEKERERERGATSKMIARRSTPSTHSTASFFCISFTGAPTLTPVRPMPVPWYRSDHHPHPLSGGTHATPQVSAMINKLRTKLIRLSKTFDWLKGMIMTTIQLIMVKTVLINWSSMLSVGRSWFGKQTSLYTTHTSLFYRVPMLVNIHSRFCYACLISFFSNTKWLFINTAFITWESVPKTVIFFTTLVLML